MKKWLIGILILLIVLVICVYVSIPRTQTLSKAIAVACNADGASRFISREKNWSKWMSFSGSRRGAVFAHAIEVRIPSGDSSIGSWITSLPSNNPDTTTVQWQLSLEGGWNPLTRIRIYRTMGFLEDSMSKSLLGLRNLIDKEGVYGIDIREVTTTDSFLVMKKTAFSAQPTTEQLYRLFRELRAYSSHHGVVRTGYPMVNVTQTSRDQFLVNAALPIDRKIPATSDFLSRSLVHGKYLMTEVKGGPSTVGEAFRSMQNYVDDHQRTSMAIPFQSLLTDRLQEADTARWTTRIYFPIY